MGSSTAVKVALLATCLLVQHALAQRGGGAMIGSGSGSSEEETGRGGRGARAGRGSGSSGNADNNNMAMTLGSETPTLSSHLLSSWLFMVSYLKPVAASCYCGVFPGATPKNSSLHVSQDRMTLVLTIIEHATYT